MKTKNKPFVYSNLLGQLRDELQHLLNIQLTSDDDHNVDRIQAKWNALVNCCTKWIQIADNTLVNPYLRKKFHKEAKKELINIGTIIISELNTLSCKNTKAKFKKRKLIEELNDRVKYIRSNY